MAESPSGEMRISTAPIDATVAIRRPHGRNSANMLKATTACWTNPTRRSTVMVVPKTLNTAASSQSEPGP